MEYLTIQQYAEKYNMSESGVRKQLDRGDIKNVFKKGKKWLIPDIDVNEKPQSNTLLKLSDQVQKTELEAMLAEAATRKLDAERKQLEINGDILAGKELMDAKVEIEKQKADINAKKEKQTEKEKMLTGWQEQIEDRQKQMDSEDCKLKKDIESVRKRERAVERQEVKLRQDREIFNNDKQTFEQVKNEYNEQIKTHQTLMEQEYLEVKALHNKLAEWVAEWEINKDRNNNRRAKSIRQYFGWVIPDKGE